jgi:hypothetical protein
LHDELMALFQDRTPAGNAAPELLRRVQQLARRYFRWADANIECQSTTARAAVRRSARKPSDHAALSTIAYS